jgi:hypothetical protein
MDNTKSEIRKVSEIVLKLLKEDDRARNDDKWLTYKVFREYTNIYIPFEDFQTIPSFETVSRVRRKIQNKDKLYQPTSAAVINKRTNRRHIFKEMMRA